MAAITRHPAVSGRFYPSDPNVLLHDVRSYLSPQATTNPSLGCIVPHAGYVYSGLVAGAVYAQLEIPQRIIILCPNHTGKGRPLAIMSQGAWETPLGLVPIDTPLAGALKKSFPLLTEDADAHRHEHAIEVELPFLQARRSDFIFVPLALGTAQFDILEKLGEAVADTIRSQSDKILIIASSDMNHYESDTVTRIKDHKAIERMLALDPRSLFDVVMREEISMCGFGPAVAMLTATKRLGATSAQLIKYATSGDVSGDREMVVGYAGIVVR
ncbi:MAG TPA: AmmeMemoRadiSam system protein B [Terriglobales bacterium]|nr:AmmeMemoRadiSam system protein B [Terriglobales bacterium]